MKLICKLLEDLKLYFTTVCKLVNHDRVSIESRL